MHALFLEGEGVLSAPLSSSSLTLKLSKIASRHASLPFWWHRMLLSRKHDSAWYGSQIKPLYPCAMRTIALPLCAS
jgi:hypothetical protein